jgi:hypothetical protein
MRRLEIGLLVLAAVGCQTAPPLSTRSAAAQAAIQDLARTASVPESEITVVSESEATWPDACLGCAGEREMCAQVVTPGSRVVLLARGVTYEYHTGRAGAVRRCP